MCCPFAVADFTRTRFLYTEAIGGCLSGQFGTGTLPYGGGYWVGDVGRESRRFRPPWIRQVQPG